MDKVGDGERGEVKVKVFVEIVINIFKFYLFVSIL